MTKTNLFTMARSVDKILTQTERVSVMADELKRDVSRLQRDLRSLQIQLDVAIRENQDTQGLGEYRA